MSTRKSGLGRNLNALLGNSVEIIAKTNTPTEQLRKLPVEWLQRGKYQPRRDMNEASLQELADSIKTQGIIQPIIVRSVGTQRYEIIAGERRWRAAQLAGMHEVPVIINEIPDETAIAVALIENIQREDLNPIEESRALQRLLEEFKLTHQQVAEAVGKSRTTVTNLLRLMSLNDEVKTLLERGDIEMGHARALLSLSGDQQTNAARQIAANGLSVRETEKLVKKLNTPQVKTVTHKPADRDVARYEQQLTERLGAKVAIQQGVGGRGKLIIDYFSVDELDGIIGHLVEK